MHVATVQNRAATSLARRGSIFKLVGVAVPAVLAIMAFGPYVIGSIRLEQLFLYGMLALLFPLVLMRCLYWYGWSVLLPWLTLLAIALISAQSDVIHTLPWESNSMLGGIDALLVPVAVMALVWTIVPLGRGKRAFDIFASTVVVLGLINTVLVLLSIVVDTTAFLRMFWAGSGATDTVAERALTMGRYSGIFNQPAESGAFYSIALLLAVYRFRRNPQLLVLVFAGLVLGSVFSVSKVVLFVGIPVALLYMLISLGLWRMLANFPFIISVGSILIALSTLLDWSGLDFLTRFVNFDENQDLLGLLTAGRFSGGGDSTLMRVIGPIADASPIIGVGVGGVAAPYDSGWVEVFVYAGVIGVLCMALVYLATFVATLRLKNTDLRFFGLAFLVTVFLTNTGISIFNANRIASITWATLALLFLCLRDEQNQRQNQRRDQHP